MKCVRPVPKMGGGEGTAPPTAWRWDQLSLTRSPFCHQEAAAGGLASKEERSPQTLTPAGEDASKTPSPVAAEEAGEPETKGNS